MFESLQTVYPEAVAISARSGLNLDQLGERVQEIVRGKELHIRLKSPISDGRLISFLRAHAIDLREEYDGSQVTMEAWLGKNQTPHLRHLGAEQVEIL